MAALDAPARTLCMTLGYATGGPLRRGRSIADRVDSAAPLLPKLFENEVLPGEGKRRMRCVLVVVALLLLPAPAVAQEWPAYGGDAGGRRYSAAGLITRDNVHLLAPAWTFHTGEQPRPGPNGMSFEDTPILADGKLLICTPSDRVIALDPLTGRQEWAFDPKLPADLKPMADFICRGVAVWRDAEAASDAACRARVALATLDARVIELDLATGRPCEGFGDHGTVTLTSAPPPLYPGELVLDSPPAVLGDTLIVGSGIDDMTRTDTPSAEVRALDARTGAPRWRFDPSPTRDGARLSGGGNVWAPIAVDEASGLVFLPTAGPSASYWGGERPGEDSFASSVVALDGATGSPVWRFQTTHHDIFDYDVAAQPTLATIRRDGSDVPVAIVPTKTGFVFVLDRATGRPLFPVAEQPVPASDVPGENASPTQPIPAAPPPLIPQRLTADDAWGLTFIDRLLCRRKIAPLRSEGLYTPPSLGGSIMYPFAGGGVNWGGGAFDPGTGLYIVNSMNLAHVVRLIPQADYAAARAAEPKAEIGRGLGAPYAAERTVLLSPLGVPCNAPPWGTLAAIDVSTGAIRWQVPLGSMAMGLIRGTPNLGGPIVTASGLVFIAAAIDDKLRAFDDATGRELWHAPLPAGGQATPMTYVAGGRQFVVIAAGGNYRMGSKLGDAVVAFALTQ
jgi:quinoprotein glucose dehydrogenase